MSSYDKSTYLGKSFFWLTKKYIKKLFTHKEHREVFYSNFKDNVFCLIFIFPYILVKDIINEYFIFKKIKKDLKDLYREEK